MSGDTTEAAAGAQVGPVVAAGPSPASNPSESRPEKTGQNSTSRDKQIGRAHFLAIAYVVLVACLVTLRALVGGLSFLSFGWILVVAAVPLLPWLAPIVVPIVERIAPSIQSVKVGVLQIDLRQAQPVVAALGVAAQTLSAASATSEPDFYSTNAMSIITGMDAVHEKGAGLVIVDLQDGGKWRVPNLYFLARLLEADPVVHHIVFTEARGGIDGFFVGVCTPRDVHLRIEAVVPVYAAAAQAISIPRDMAAPDAADRLAAQFNALRAGLTPPASSASSDGRQAVTSAWIRSVLGLTLSDASIEGGEALTEDEVRAIVRSSFRYVATTSAGRFTGVIDREPVALAVARRAIDATGVNS